MAFRIHYLRFGVQVLECVVHCLWCVVQVLGIAVHCLSFGVQGLGCAVDFTWFSVQVGGDCGLWFRFWDLLFIIHGLGFRVRKF